MENHKVVYAIADNIISSLGVTTAQNMDNVLSEKSGIENVVDKDSYPEPFMASRLDWSIVDQSLGLERLEKMMVASVADALSQTSIDATSKNTIFIFSSTKGNIELLKNANGRVPANAYLQNMAKNVSRHFGSTNQSIVVSNACISGVLAQVVAARLLKMKKYDNAIVVGGDTLSEFVISGFESFKSISKELCRPYDKGHCGLNIGEGVATLILSSDKSLVKDSIPIMLAGGASSNDANHISGPSRTGEELAMAINDALKEAGLKSDEIDLVDAHGTATVYNDDMESKALGICQLNQKPVISLKGYFGHTLGASGLMESIICIESIRRQMLPKTLGYEEPGTPVALNINDKTQGASIRNVVKTASGFGGSNAAIVFSTQNKGEIFGRLANIQIERKCEIENGVVKIDQNKVFESSENTNFGEFVRAAFKNIVAEPYMKFGKMDDLCKLAVTTAEYLLNGYELDKYDSRSIALLLNCKSSSLDTDIQHQSTIEDKGAQMASPAIFVYTLANIMQGEICIRHKIKGECMVLVSDDTNDDKLTEMASFLLAQNKAKLCIVGNVDYLKGEYSSRLSLMTQKY